MSENAPELADTPISVSTARLAPIFEQARAAGIGISGLLKALELPQSLAEDDRGRHVSLADFYRIQNRLMLLIGDETLHLSSRQLLPGSTDFVLRNVGDCKNLYEVMRVIARSYNMLHGGEYNSVVRTRNTIDYIIDDRKFPYAAHLSTDFYQFSTECLLIFLHCMLMTISDLADEAVRGLGIRRLSPGGDCGHLGYWDAPIKFGAAVYSLSFARSVAETPIAMPPAHARSANAIYQKILEAVAGTHARHQQLQSMTHRVRDSLERGVIEQGDIAAQIGVSVSTLRRRLGEEGAGFRDLRNEVLNERAKRLLAERHSLADVADMLGFSEFRAFNRAFKAWNGMTPKAYQRQINDRNDRAETE